MKTNSLYFISPRVVEIREENLPAISDHQLLVKAKYSAISAGSEMLIYRGLGPKDLKVDDTINSLNGNLNFPLKYGYSMVGQVLKIGSKVSKEWQDKMVFSFRPHQSYFISTPDELKVIPERISPEDAVFFPNIETAVNFIMDGNPQLGENILLLGQGIVGLLTASILAMHPINKFITVDNFAKRREISKNIGAESTYSVDEITNILKNDKGKQFITPNFDLIYELSGNPQALDLAISMSRFDGRIVIGSWYGDKTAPINLGGDFHRKRINIISSQVSTIAPIYSGRWNKERRNDLVWEMISKINPKKFITHKFNIENASAAYQKLDKEPQNSIQMLLTYSD